ncbi:hypothetical protein BWQ96_03908 [Gracilariopsis chorda]|uniref:Protein farnesyltransferase/geranylgeranyltransferase type-1 subunit alpha n=1 Tax=Gracilariopsis chorda TaxID=448386 RepID=A0A2V3IVU7_9FLOR|nr:hypothetical protein BWQ96_03908 [Gracilariopsis chorda]|eukprot:PXF46252.1 hypothetical protein BWQ96_03908 [Gracilariopsis chorda]
MGGMDELVALIAQTFNSKDIFNLEEVGVIVEPRPREQAEVDPKNALQAKDGYIGIRSWVLPKLYKRSIARLVENREDIDASTSLLLTTPDNLTAWNARKAHTTRDNIATELEFSRLMLTRAPKSAESWSHRAWILREHAYPPSAEQMEIELQLAWFAASRSAHNYYAGVHRARLLPWLSESMAERERNKSRKWLQTHVTDASGWWYHRALRSAVSKDERSEDGAEQQWFHDMHGRYAQSSQNVAVQERLYRT